MPGRFLGHAAPPALPSTEASMHGAIRRDPNPAAPGALAVAGRCRMSARAAVAAAALVAALLVLAFFHGVSRDARADYIPPSQVVVKTEAYRPVVTDFPNGAYDYQVLWEGIPVGTASIHVARTERAGVKMFDVVATACSSQFISLFYRLRHRSESIFSAQQLRPVEFRSQQTENTRFTNLKIDFSPGGRVDATITKGRSNGATSSKEVSFQSDNATFDPISAAFLARSLPMEPAQERSFDVFNGEDRYLITLQVMGREQIEIGGRRHQAFKVRPQVRKLTDTEGEKRVRRAYLWLAADAGREVLKLESVVRLGAISARLIGFYPDGSTQPRRFACEG
jgi:hypothetical protein